MQLQTREYDGIMVVKIPDSRLDYNNANGFKNAMLNLADQGFNRFAVDMADVEFMDSRGLSSFLSLFRATGKGGAMALFLVQEPVRKIFTLTRTERIIQIHSNLEEALTSLRRPAGT